MSVASPRYDPLDQSAMFGIVDYIVHPSKATFVSVLLAKLLLSVSTVPCRISLLTLAL